MVISLFVHDDKIWVLGGIDAAFNFYADIWSSTDSGLTWTEVSPTDTHWAGRSYHQSFIHDDKIWILGGTILDGTVNHTNDIWSSADSGLTWTEVSPIETHWSGRSGHQSFVHDDKIWVLGGYDGNSYKNDIWTSADSGITWKEVSPTETHWSGRSGHQSFVYDDKIWVLGGYVGNSFNESAIVDYRNDIWSSADGGVTWEEVIPSFY